MPLGSSRSHSHGINSVTAIVTMAVTFVIGVAAIGLVLNTTQQMPYAYNQYEQSASYVVFITSAGITTAKNCTTGRLDYSNLDPAETISEALANLPAEGGLVYVKSGHYALHSSIEVKRDNWALVGEMGAVPWTGSEGGAKLTKTGDFSMLNCSGEYDGGRIGYSHILIKDISLGNLGGTGHAVDISYCSDVELDRVYISSFIGSGVYAYGCYAPNIHDSWLWDNGNGTQADIVITGAADVDNRSTVPRIHNVNFEVPTYAAVYVDNCDSIQITGCFGEVIDTDDVTEAYFIIACRDAYVDGNQLVSSNGDMVKLLNGSTNPKITNNWFAGAAGYAVNDSRTIAFTGGSSGGTFSGNNIQSGTRGFRITNYTIVDSNMIGYCDFEGINITGSNNIISNNQVFKNGQDGSGIRAGVYAHSGHNNIISGNSFWDTGSPVSQVNCYLESNAATYNTIISNTMKNSPYKVNLSGSADSLVKNNLGYITENSGYVDVDPGNSTVSVAHGVDSSLTYVLCSARPVNYVAVGVHSWNATHITFTYNNTAASFSIMWYAGGIGSKDYGVYV